MRSLLLRCATTSVLLLALAACDRDPSAPDALSLQESADVAAAVGRGVTESLDLMTSGESSMPSLNAASTSAHTADGAQLAQWAAPAGCTFDDASGRFDCQAQHDQGGGLTLERSFAVFDAAGQPQTSYDPSTTASMNFRAGVTGTVTGQLWNATIDHQLDLTVSGLEGAETQRTWNGTGTVDDHAVYQGPTGTRSYAMTASTTMTDVVVRLPRSTYPWPMSGTVTQRVQATGTYDGAQTVTRSFERDATVTFNGTQFVPLVVGGEQFTLNLANGQVTRPS